MPSLRLASATVALALATAACSSASAPQWTFGPPSSPLTAQATPAMATAEAAMATAEAAMATGAPMPTAAPAMIDAPSAAPGMTAMGPASPTPAPSATADATATTVDVTLSDMMKIEPGRMTVPAGVPVTFRVTNTGTVRHEFTLGDAAEQDAHDKEMAAQGGMSMPADEPNAIGVEPGQTKTLTFTFDTPGLTLAGCHVIGHYAAGMKADIQVQ